jgi:hypothetical protein
MNDSQDRNDPSRVITYGELFEYIESQIEQEGAKCDKTLQHAKQFAEMHGLCFEGLSDILANTGGNCDCKVLLNSIANIPEEEVIGIETFTAPMRIAIEEGFYCHCHIEGAPVAFSKAMAAKEAGQKVEMWVPCNEDDPHAMPDLNRAVARNSRPEE